MLAICADLIPVQVTTTSINIDLLKLQPTSALPEISSCPESKDDGKCKIRLEEALDIVETVLPWRSNGSEELEYWLDPIGMHKLLERWLKHT